MHLLDDTRTGGSDVSHTIFQIFPADTNRLFSKCRFETVSRWALDLLLDQYKARRADKIADSYYDISAMPDSASLRGHLFERQVLSHLCGIDTERTFFIRGLTNSDIKMKWTYRGPIRRCTVFNEFTNAVQDRKPLHFVPPARNFPAAYSILYDPDDPDAALTCIQITLNMDHAIVVSDLQLIQSWLRLGTPLECLRPKKTKPWRLLFVVPFDMESTFKLQKHDGDTTHGEWAGKVHQYVLGLKEQTIFGRNTRVQYASTSQQGEQLMMDVDDTYVQDI